MLVHVGLNEPMVVTLSTAKSLATIGGMLRSAQHDRPSGYFRRAVLDMNGLAALQVYLTAQDDVALAYLFGSRADGQAAPESDYDIAVLTRPTMPPARRYQMASELSTVLGGTPVDLVVLNRAPVELAYAIVAEGRRLLERDVAARIEFEADVMSRYGDFVYTLREQRTDRLRGGIHEAGIRRNRAALRQTERVLAEVRAAAQQDAG